MSAEIHAKSHLIKKYKFFGVVDRVVSRIRCSRVRETSVHLFQRQSRPGILRGRSNQPKTSASEKSTADTQRKRQQIAVPNVERDFSVIRGRIRPDFSTIVGISIAVHRYRPQHQPPRDLEAIKAPRVSQNRASRQIERFRGIFRRRFRLVKKGCVSTTNRSSVQK